MREPTELDPPTEFPNKLASIVTYHIRNLGYSVTELLKSLRLGESDFSRLYKLHQSHLKVIK